MSTPILSQIENIVVLMLENRSLDSLLGNTHCSSSDDGSPQPVPYVYPSGSSDYFNGSFIPDTNQPVQNQTIIYGRRDNKSETFSPQRNTTDTYNVPTRVPHYDPNEEFEDVSKQMYGDAEGNYQYGLSQKAIYDIAPLMEGFVSNYGNNHTPQSVMGGYSRSELPVLYGLAENYAISDDWFASIPTQTDCNRAFHICGTSLGYVDNSEAGGAYVNTNTFFNEIAGKKSFGIYYQNNWLGSGGGIPGWDNCYTVDKFAKIQDEIGPGHNGYYDTYASFLQLLDNNDALPDLCYIEPFWGGGKGLGKRQDHWTGVQGNDYHPCADIGPAEYDLNELYNKLKSHPNWDKMLFVIMFDEHGGSWDHVPPPQTVKPDDNQGDIAADYSFTFERLGVRVPFILVSPYVKPGTVFRAPSNVSSVQKSYDHTSFIATVLKWAGVDPASANLGSRVAQAPTFEEVIQDSIQITQPPSFTVPSSYQSACGGVGSLLDPVTGITGFNLNGSDKTKVKNIMIDILAAAGLLAGMSFL